MIKVPPESRKILEQEEGSILENVLLESYIGFSKVFKLLVTLKKPIIAHNSFLDFMFMHQQFYKPLPRMCNCIIKKVYFYCVKCIYIFQHRIIFKIFLLFMIEMEMRIKSQLIKNTILQEDILISRIIYINYFQQFTTQNF